MALPFFYNEEVTAGSDQLVLNEETSKHVVQVLRMQNTEQLNLTDGKGNLFTTAIIDDHKKRCTVKILSTNYRQPSERKVTIAISLIKNTSRFEWFLEKATEIGVSEIIPLICERTEKQHFRFDRMKNILVSAMLQSQQCWLPILQKPIAFDKLLKNSSYDQKFIAHCIEEQKRNLTDLVNENLSAQIILIGPEGDFTAGEIQMAEQDHFIPVALGNTRLRTETAGMVAATLLCNI